MIDARDVVDLLMLRDLAADTGSPTLAGSLQPVRPSFRPRVHPNREVLEVCQ